MANIRVEPKNKTPGTLWIWVVVVLVIAALVYFLVTRDQTNSDTTVPADTTGAIRVPASYAQHNRIS